MLKRIFLSLLSLVLLTFPLWAQEQTAFEPLPTSFQKEDLSSSHFGLKVLGDGHLVTEPGTVFTAGVERPGTILPSLISTPKPIRYPKWALRQGWHGQLILALEILADGSVGRYAVMKSTGHTILDEAGISAAKTWQFEPANYRGMSFTTCIQIPIAFELDAK